MLDRAKNCAKWRMVREEGHTRPPGFSTRKLVSRVYSDPSDSGNSRTVEYLIHNCQRDAFKTAAATLSERKSRYGAGSIELSRWIEAQIDVFAQCSGETAPRTLSRQRVGGKDTLLYGWYGWYGWYSRFD